MDNKVILEGILWDLKGICDLCLHGSIESGTSKNNKVFRDSLIELLNNQHELYTLMSNNDMYNVCEVAEVKVKEAKDKYNETLECE